MKLLRWTALAFAVGYTFGDRKGMKFAEEYNRAFIQSYKRALGCGE